MKRAILALLMWAATAGPVAAVGSVTDITIFDRTENRTLPVYFHQGRHYVVGKPGNEYQINLRNHQSADVLSVVSVDGVNVVSGETANWAQTGYVLGAHSSYGIKGWRKSTQRIAAFYFTEIDNSYAARTGRPENVGVVGVAVFRRKPEPVVVAPPAVVPHPYRERQGASPGSHGGIQQDAARSQVGDNSQLSAEARAERADSAPRPSSAPAPQPAEKSLGTGHGRGETSVVRYTHFEKASQTPDEIITIYYDSYRNLLAQGVIAAPLIARPSPFPGQFVPDPR